MANGLKNLGRSIWSLGEALYQRFSQSSYGISLSKKIKELESSLKEQIDEKLDGKNLDQTKYNATLKKLTELINLKRSQNKAIATEVYSVIKNIVNTAGSILLLTPFSLLGFGMVVVSSSLDALDIFNKNPIVRLMDKINTFSKKTRGKPLFDPFGEKTEQDVEKELTAAVKKAKAKKATTLAIPGTHGLLHQKGLTIHQTSQRATPSNTGSTAPLSIPSTYPSPLQRRNSTSAIHIPTSKADGKEEVRSIRSL